MAKSKKVKVVKKVSKFGIAKFLVMALVLGGGLMYGTQMVQKNQENRSSATSRSTVYTAKEYSGGTTAECSKYNGKCGDFKISLKTGTVCKVGSVLGIISSIKCGDYVKVKCCVPVLKPTATPTPIKKPTPTLNRKKTITPIPKNKCTSVMYSTWGPCKNGKQTRSIWEKNPSGCVVENPILIQTCKVTPTPIKSR